MPQEFASGHCLTTRTGEGPRPCPLLAGREMVVAVMQPYFYPYAGYFRLFAEARTFVIYDCVQFPRRGRVHRANILGPSGATEWLSLPLERQPRNTAIRDIAFASNARALFDQRLARLPALKTAPGPIAEQLRDHLFGPLDDPVEFLSRGLRMMVDILGLDTRFVRSSTLAIDPALHGQDRIIAIVKAVGARRYVNAPGGRALYDSETFERNGLTLSFLDPYQGPMLHMINDLLNGGIDPLRNQLLAMGSQPIR